VAAEHKTVVLTRTPEQSESMARALSDLGVRVISFPTIELIPPPDEDIIRQAVTELGTYDWIIFTSINAVNHFFAYLDNGDACMQLPKIAAVGPATASALAARGYKVNLMPVTRFQAEGLVEAFVALSPSEKATSGEKPDAKKGRILIPRALAARDVLVEELPKLGYRVTVAPVYETVRARPGNADIDAIEEAEGIVFTSPSTVRNFIDILDDTKIGKGLAYLGSRKIFSIGPITTAELYDNSASENQIFEAKESTGKGLVELIATRL